MALVARFLIDTSASARFANPTIQPKLSRLIELGLVATCGILDAEALFSARTPAEYECIRENRREAYEYLPTNDEHWQTALEAQHELSRTGRHRAVAIGDLLIASLATAHGLTIIHYDADFETAALALTFTHHWVAPRGAL